MELKDIIEQSNTIATEKRFWEDYDISIKKMKGLPDQYTDDDIERIKMAFYNEKIALILSELGEAVESMRLGRFYKGGKKGIEELLKSSKESSMYPSTFITHVKDTFEDEISDTFIRLCDLCYKMNIDIETFIKLKLEYNKRRDDRHGKKF
jgi:NTP pyrophosphatase (non-canonical NTP hydrolase)